VDEVSSGIQDKKGGVGYNAVLFGERNAFALLHIELYADEVGVHEVGHLVLGEYGFGHIPAGTTPAGKSIHKDGLVNAFSLGKANGEGGILEAYAAVLG
jgi:hypothetical protein